MRSVLVLPLTLGLLACPPSDPAPKAPASQPASAPASSAAKGTTPATRAQVDPDGVVRRGVPIAHDEAMTVGALYASADTLDGQTVTVTGEVTHVCKKKGCWMAIRGDEGGPSVRITAKGYAYFVPADATGMHATVKGEVSVKTLDAATARHYAEESGDPEAAPKGGAREVAIASVGLELRR